MNMNMPQAQAWVAEATTYSHCGKLQKTGKTGWEPEALRGNAMRAVQTLPLLASLIKKILLQALTALRTGPPQTFGALLASMY